jgi:hypothetical protein
VPVNVIMLPTFHEKNFNLKQLEAFAILNSLSQLQPQSQRWNVAEKQLHNALVIHQLISAGSLKSLGTLHFPNIEI